MVQSHDSIWQDTIDDSIENIVNELTHSLNYSSGYADDALKDITDALCGKSLREKLLENFSALEKSVEQDEE